VCRRFEKDGSPKDRLVKPFDSVKTGSGESSQMAYPTERLIKLEKKQKQSTSQDAKVDLSSSLGNRSIAASYRYRSWQL
jgi:hypothetical protein